ncbi:MAG: bifunctional DNA primase/polymerase, partial [Candidatus Igneacidithiobacillus chanchocoensis]
MPVINEYRREARGALTQQNPTTKAEAALIYASWGWHVLPVVTNGKVPATLHGVKDATTDPEQIAKW